MDEILLPIALAAKDSGDSTGLWWVVVPMALVVLAALLLVDRSRYRRGDRFKDTVVDDQAQA